MGSCERVKVALDYGEGCAGSMRVLAGGWGGCLPAGSRAEREGKERRLRVILPQSGRMSVFRWRVGNFG